MRQKSLFTGFIVDNFWFFRTRTVFMLKIPFFLRTFCPKACIPQPNRVLYYYKKSREPKEVYFMEWTDIRLTVAKADADNAEAVATMIAEGGIYIEDYSDIEQQVAENVQAVQENILLVALSEAA